MNLFKLLFVFLLCVGTLFAKPKKDENTQLLAEQNGTLMALESRINDIEKSLSKKNIWLKKYSDFQTYKKVASELESVREKIGNLKHKRDDLSAPELKVLTQKEEAYKKQLILLGDYKSGPLGDLVAVEEIPAPPEVRNPFAIVVALSYIKQLGSDKDIYEARLSELSKTVELLYSKKIAMVEYMQKAAGSKEGLFKVRAQFYDAQLPALTLEITELLGEKDDFESTIAILSKKSGEITQKLQSEIKAQGTKLFSILLVILLLIVLSTLAKLAFKRYLGSQHERGYVANKAINAVAITLVIMVLLFAYINNVAYLVTILGFASAGIAIAMKDWFMSVLGWIAIVGSGSIRVGDRIKISKEGAEVLGDVLDISLLKITLYEEVSWVSIQKNSRAGRIVFVPNNFIFTTVVFNYSHAGLHTVWDGVNVTVTFDSDLDLALKIVRAIAEKHSETFSRFTDKQTGRMRGKYSMREISSEPRLFTFIDPSGVTISVWYLLSSFNILATKSAVSKEIVEALKLESSIKIAYPTTTIQVQSPHGFGAPL